MAQRWWCEVALWCHRRLPANDSQVTALSDGTQSAVVSGDSFRGNKLGITVTATRVILFSFSNGFGMTFGDLVRVGENEVRITSVDYGAQTITVDRQIEWKDGDGVSYPYVGRAPDIGAYEIGLGMDPPTGLRVIQ